MVGCPGARLSVTPRAQKSSPTLPVLYSTTSTLCTWSYNCARGGMQYHGHTTVRGEECSIMVIQLCEGRNAVSYKQSCCLSSFLPLYLFSHVDVSFAEPVLHTRGLSTESQLVCGSSLHPAGSYHLCCHPCVTVEGELDLLGLPGQKSAMEREDIKHLSRRKKRGKEEKGKRKKREEGWKRKGGKRGREEGEGGRRGRRGREEREEGEGGKGRRRR